MRCDPASRVSRAGTAQRHRHRVSQADRRSESDVLRHARRARGHAAAAGEARQEELIVYAVFSLIRHSFLVIWTHPNHRFWVPGKDPR